MVAAAAVGAKLLAPSTLCAHSVCLCRFTRMQVNFAQAAAAAFTAAALLATPAFADGGDKVKVRRKGSKE